MGRDDTFPIQDTRIRIPFRDMTTTEAEYHAETMWPYYDVRIAALLEERLKILNPQATRESVMQTLAELMELNAASAEERTRIRNAFRFLRIVVQSQAMLARICFRCLLPWTLAAGAGLAGMLLNDNFPVLASLLAKLKLLGQE
jgi:hypothetical protein